MASKVVDLCHDDSDDECIVAAEAAPPPSTASSFSMWKLKLSMDSKPTVVISIDSKATVDELKAMAAEKWGFPHHEALTLKHGFPPRTCSPTSTIDSVLQPNDRIIATINTSVSSKRAATDNNGAHKRSRSLQQPQESNETLGTTSPIKLFQTNLDQNYPSPLVHEHCLTMRQMLGLDASRHYTSHCTTDWMVVSNFMVDFDHLLDTVPELVSIPTCVVFYEQDCSSSMLTSMLTGMSAQTRWKQSASGQVEFCRISPKEVPRSEDPTSANPLPYRFPYGTHHTKMFLVGQSNGTLRVIIQTANLLPGDQGVKVQGAFIQDFPLKSLARANGTLVPDTSHFEEDLVDYLQTYGYEKPQRWAAGHASMTLCDQLKLYDFSAAKGVLIASTPGYYTLGSNMANNRGYLKLSKAIRQHCPVATMSEPVVCQFSSLGDLSVKWLEDFASHLNASQEECAKLEKSLSIVFPTSDEIRNSVEGYVGGGTVPSNKKNVSKAFLKPLWHKWSPFSSINPLHKPNNVPHIKTYFQRQGGEPNNNLEWFCLTSHNLSKPAWGQKRTNKRGKHFYVASWELGVFVAPSLFGPGVTMSPVVPTGGGSTALTSTIGIPMPYSVHPTKYHSDDDEPFCWEEEYPTAPDRFGRIGVKG